MTCAYLRRETHRRRGPVLKVSERLTQTCLAEKTPVTPVFEVSKTLIAKDVLKDKWDFIQISLPK